MTIQSEYYERAERERLARIEALRTGLAPAAPAAPTKREPRNFQELVNEYYGLGPVETEPEMIGASPRGGK